MNEFAGICSITVGPDSKRPHQRCSPVLRIDNPDSAFLCLLRNYRAASGARYAHEELGAVGGE
jgi:hypothetical protein